MKADLQKHTLYLREGDWDYLESLFRQSGIATSLVIRTLVSNYVDKKRKEYEPQASEMPHLDINLGDRNE